MWMNGVVQGINGTSRERTSSRMGENGVVNLTYSTKDNCAKKLLIVCGKCNNGWMSVLQTAVKPIFIRMMKEESLTLTKNDLHTISAWVVMQAVTAEHDHLETSACTKQQLSWLYRHKEAPPDWCIFIARYKGTAWSKRFKHYGLKIAMPEKIINPNLTAFSDLEPPTVSEGKKHNSQITIIGFGNIVFYVTSTTLKLFTGILHKAPDSRFTQIWPPQKRHFFFGQKMLWPCADFVVDQELEKMATNLHIEVLQRAR